MSSVLTISVDAASPNAVLVQLLDTTPKPPGYLPVQGKILRIYPGERHELAVCQGISLCILDDAPQVRVG